MWLLGVCMCVHACVCVCMCVVSTLAQIAVSPIEVKALATYWRLRLRLG
jgi:hypothetical protein